MRAELEAIGASIYFVRNVRVEVECDSLIESQVKAILSKHQYVVVDSDDYNGRRSLRAV